MIYKTKYIDDLKFIQDDDTRRVGGPRCIYNDGDLDWNEGINYREGGPDIIHPDGAKGWHHLYNEYKSQDAL